MYADLSVLYRNVMNVSFSSAVDGDTLCHSVSVDHTAAEIIVASDSSDVVCSVCFA